MALLSFKGKYILHDFDGCNKFHAHEKTTETEAKLHPLEYRKSHRETQRSNQEWTIQRHT